MNNFPCYDDTDDTPQTQVRGEEQHLPQPSTHTSGRQTPALPTLPPPPPLTPHYTHPTSATGADFLHLIKFLEETILQEDAVKRNYDDRKTKSADKRIPDSRHCYR